MTIGDVLAMIAAIVTTAAAWGAMILLAALLFPAKSIAAEQCLTTRPWACLFRGMAVVAILTIVALVVVNNGFGPFRLIAGTIAGLAGLLSAIGSAGVVRLIASRDTETTVLNHKTMLRATTIYILSGLLPIIGWLLVTPVFLLISVGAGMGGFMVSKKPVPASAPLPTLEMGL